MTNYIVRLRFWVRAFDDTEVSAATDEEAVKLAMAAASSMMEKKSQPVEIDAEDRREGLISYIDRLDEQRDALDEAIVFANDRPLHPEARRLVEKLAALNRTQTPEQAQRLLWSLIDEARALPCDGAAYPFDLSDEPEAENAVKGRGLELPHQSQELPK